MEKIDPIKRADIMLLRGLGYSITEIAVNKFKERAEKVGYQWAFVEILLQAGPAYPLFSVFNGLRNLGGGRIGRRSK